MFLALSHFDNDIASNHHTPMCFRTFNKVHDPDLPNYKEAMSGDYSTQFKKATDDEIDGLVKRDTWTLVPRGNQRTIPGTWAFR